MAELPDRAAHRSPRKRGGLDLARSFLLAVVPELLEVGPQVPDVLVVLDADKRHAGAGHSLHGRADIGGEGFLAPGNAGALVGFRVIEPFPGAGLAAVDAVERRTELDLRLRPDVVAG